MKSIPLVGMLCTLQLSMAIQGKQFLMFSAKSEFKCRAKNFVVPFYHADIFIFAIKFVLCYSLKRNFLGSFVSF